MIVVSLIQFIIAVIFSILIPGIVLLKHTFLSSFQKLVLGFGLGLVAWGIQGYLFGYGSVRWMSYLYILGFATAFFYRYKKKRLKLKFSQKIDKNILIIIILGVFLYMVPNIFNGVSTRGDGGLYYCCNTPDIFYHTALVNELISHIPPREPGMSSHIVTNYHYFSNLMIADLIRIFHLPLLETVNYFIPLTISFVLGMSIVVFSQMLEFSNIAKRWLLFLAYFSGDSIYLISLVLGKGLNFTPALMPNAITMWDSPPRVFAFLLLFTGMSLFIYSMKKKTIYIHVLSGIVFASLIGIKVYIAFFGLIGYVMTSLMLLTQVNNKKYVISLVITIFVCLLIYMPGNSNAGGLFFSGFWRVEDFIVNPAFGLTQLELARVVFLEHNNYFRVFLYQIFYLILYCVALFGMVFFSLFQNKQTLKKLPLFFHIFLLSGISVCFILGMFFLQYTGGANTSQFLFPTFIGMSIYAVVVLDYWVKRIKNAIFRLTFLIVIVIVLIPRVFYETQQILRQINNNKGFFISREQVNALEYLSNKTERDAIIFIDNSFTVTKKDDIVKDNFLYYVPFLSNRSVFLVGSGILADHGVGVRQRREIQEKIMNSDNLIKHATLLKGNKIDYMYISKKSTFYAFQKKQKSPFIKTVYENKEVVLYKVI